MSRKTESEIVDIVTSELTFLPTDGQKRAKSAFWSRFNENPLCDPTEVSLSIVGQFINDGRVEKWWSQVGFREWFTNNNEFRDRLEYLSHKILDSLEYVLDDPKAQANAKVNAAKLILEASRKLPRQAPKVEYLDEQIASMTKKELEDFIAKKTKQPLGLLSNK